MLIRKETQIKARSATSENLCRKDKNTPKSAKMTYNNTLYTNKSV